MEKYWQGVEGRYNGFSSGLDKLYEDAYQRGGSRIDESLAARGMGNSGLALRSRNDLQTQLAGQRTQDELGWLTAGGSMAGAAQNQQQNREMLPFQSAMQLGQSMAGTAGQGLQNIGNTDLAAILALVQGAVGGAQANAQAKAGASQNAAGLAALAASL